MKRIISLFLVMTMLFSLGIALAEEYRDTSLITVNNPTSLFIYDLNKDGKEEILITSIDGNLYAYDKSGVQKWNYLSDDTPYTVYVDDIDGDGLAEIIVGTGKINPQTFRYSSGKIILLNHFGKQEWTYDTTSAIKAIYVSDIDGDLGKEILASSEDGVLYVVDIKGVLKWDEFTGSRSPAFSANLAGGTDVLIAHGQAILNSKGKIVGRAPDLFEWKKYILKDLNKDGKSEFLMLSNYPFISAFNLEGTDLKGVWQYQCDGDAMDVIVNDLNGDGNLEVIASSSKWLDASKIYGEGKIYILNANDGTLKESIPLSSAAFYIGVTDINEDGKKDIVYTTEKGVNSLLFGVVTQEPPKEQTPPKETPPTTSTPPKNTPGFEIGAVSAAALLVGYYLKRRK
ncbi:MAG: FG-GAP repeat protein [Candidatus Methanofastidiosum methylothiophilum]|uniref:FG-GAP repeat protein n=1 Tax=Candidatus Methanofastidiosum methylothiophilum TaxID=1705564 RepID=A0A150J3R0_9EURY|nr:MAG: FG-GAP repeat protein [Candidatus Methanofastidiosum methylthiophilus]NMC75820.1 VCBS repeat-containing protein [Candidatus Methanofastidiosa archaeon]